MSRANSSRQLFLISFVFLVYCWACSAQEKDHPPSPPDAPKPNAAPAKNFFARWAEFYRQDWSPSTTAASSPAPERRGLPSPLDAPPFPNSDWSYGGSPVIGEPDTNSY